MKLNVRFSETKQSFSPNFGEVHNVSDGGYERGYAEGYEIGNTEGYNKGHTEGVEQGYANGYKVGETDGEVKGRAEGEQIGFSNALAKRTEIDITENGEYIPEGESTGFSRVNVRTISKLPQVIERSVTEITVEDLSGATSIGSRAFCYCSSLKSINIPEGVTSIAQDAFRYCSNLTSIVIPESVTAIYSYALQIGLSSRKAAITFLSTTPPTIQSNTFNASYLNKIIVPKGCGEAYKTATNWSNFADYIEEAAE